MHEWALAEAVVFTALKTAKKKGLKKITEIKIKLGELQQIDEVIFKSALKEIIQSRNLRDVKIELEEEKAILKCRVCGERWPFKEAMKELNEEESESLHFLPETAHSFIKCPKCGSPDFEIIGRGISVDSIKGV